MAIVRKAAEKASAADVAALVSLIAQQRAVSGSGDNCRVPQARRGIPSGNREKRRLRGRLARARGNLKTQMDRVRFLSLPQATPLTLIIEQHVRIVRGHRDALARAGGGGDAPASERDPRLAAEARGGERGPFRRVKIRGPHALVAEMALSDREEHCAPAVAAHPLYRAFGA